MSAFGQIKIRRDDQTDDQALILNFGNRKAYDDFRRQHMKSVGTKIIDEFWGYALYEDAETAWKSVRAFC